MANDLQAFAEAQQAADPNSKAHPIESWPEESRQRFLDGVASGGPTSAQSVRSGVDTQLKKTHRRLQANTLPTRSAVARTTFKPLTPVQFLVNEQAKKALQRLGEDIDANKSDPKRTLLDLVESSWRQQRVWEAMLASIPESDFEYLGEMPIPGLKATARGARIDLIQRHLTEATKTAAKISSMAISAGIEERIVRLAEEQSALIADTVRAGVLAAIGSLRLSPKAEAAAIQAALASASSHLRLLATGIADSNDPNDPANPNVYEGIAKEVRHE